MDAENDLEAENLRKALQKGKRSSFKQTYDLVISFVNWSGYQSLALIATFLCGVEAQIIVYTLQDDNKNYTYQVFNSLLLVSMTLSMFGATTGELTCGHSLHVPGRLPRLHLLSR